MGKFANNISEIIEDAKKNQPPDMNDPKLLEERERIIKENNLVEVRVPLITHKGNSQPIEDDDGGEPW